MKENDLPFLPPLYDITQSSAFNASNGPFFKGEIPHRIKTTQASSLFGFELRSPLGVPAGPLFNARWVELAAKLGFDVVTYKTIRSFAHPGHQLPNMLYIKPISKDEAQTVAEIPPLDALTVTNSFGMPSKSPDFLLEDIDRANRCLEKGQLLIVSIVGTPDQGVSFRDDFVRTARIAQAAGAKVIEANFSCPNVGKSHGMLYTNPETVYEFAHALATAIHPIPLILKVGLFPDRNVQRACFIAAARAGARGICGINSVSMRVIDAKGQPALGASRPTSGVCGAAIREQALEFIRDGSDLIKEEKLGLSLLGCGGIVHPDQFTQFLDAGADIAMSATGMMWDPLLALRRERLHASKSHPAAV